MIFTNLEAISPLYDGLIEKSVARKTIFVKNYI